MTQSGGSASFNLTVSESVTVAGGTPTLTLNINGTATTATYVSGSGSSTLVFSATVPAGDGNSISLTAVNLVGSTITGDVTGQPLLTSTLGQSTSELTVDDTAPTLTNAALTASENATAVGTLSVSDTNGLAATGGYVLGGTDAALFSLTDAGVLALNTAANFEAPNNGDGDGVYDLTVNLTDTAGNASSPQALTVTVQNVNEAPTVATAIADSMAIANQAFSLDVSSNFADPDSGDTRTYSATGLPTGLSISTAGVISGTATSAAAATDIVVTATDAGGLTVTDTFALTVVAAPTASSTIDEVTNVDVRSPIVLTFSENVSANAGNIVLRDTNTGGSGWKNDDQDNTQTISVTDTSQVTVSGNTVTINPTFDMDFGTSYQVEIAAGAFTGSVSGQNSVAVGTGELTFTTVTPSNSGVAAQIQTAGSDALSAGLTFVSGHQSSPAPGNFPVEVDASGSSIALVLSFTNAGSLRADDGYISFKGFGSDDVLYLDRTDFDTGDDTSINGGGAWNTATDSDGGTSAQKSFSGGTFGARVIFNGQTGIFADSFLDSALSVGTGESIIIA